MAERTSVSFSLGTCAFKNRYNPAQLTLANRHIRSILRLHCIGITFGSARRCRPARAPTALTLSFDFLQGAFDKSASNVFSARTRCNSRTCLRSPRTGDVTWRSTHWHAQADAATDTNCCGRSPVLSLELTRWDISSALLTSAGTTVGICRLVSSPVAIPSPAKC